MGAVIDAEWTLNQGQQVDKKVGCSSVSEGMRFKGSAASAITIDRDDGTSTNELDGEASAEDDGFTSIRSEINIKTSNILDSESNQLPPDADASLRIYIRNDHELVVRLHFSKLEKGTRITLETRAEYQIEDIGPDSLADLIAYTQNLKEKTYPYDWTFPGQSAVTAAQRLSTSGIRLKRFKPVIDYIMESKSPQYPYPQVFHGAGAFNLALAVAADVNLQALKNQTAYWMNLKSTSYPYPFLYTPAEAWQKAFDSLGIHVKVADYLSNN